MAGIRIAAVVVHVLRHADRHRLRKNNSSSTIGVHCRKTGKDSSFVTIVVAHRSSFNEAKGVALNIRAGMEKGIFE
jgi:hypothetical protein